MRILIVGNGGREHALAWKAVQSDGVSHVYVASGNAGTAQENHMTNVNIAATDIASLVAFAKKENIHLTIVGPEAPLALGIVDAFQAEKLPCFGPNEKAAQLEASKKFSKQLMRKYGIPTASFEVFQDPKAALAYIKTQSLPIVLKADGLAAGKGVVIAATMAEAEQAIDDLLVKNKYHVDTSDIVVEAFLTGIEVSFMVVTDGEHAIPLVTSQDHKARDDGDKGPNTGGMGACSPAPMVDDTMQTKIMHDVIYPTLKGLKAEGITYAGFLYAGLMISNEGDIHVLEFNCRLGDPETQVIMMRLQSDLVTLCENTLAHQLDGLTLRWHDQKAVGVVLAAKGYPEQYAKGDVITCEPGLDTSLTHIFHAGTQLKNDQVISSGGRVLCAVALGDSIADAQKKAYAMVNKVHWSNKYFRTDIAAKAV